MFFWLSQEEKDEEVVPVKPQLFFLGGVGDLAGYDSKNCLFSVSQLPMRRWLFFKITDTSE